MVSVLHASKMLKNDETNKMMQFTTYANSCCDLITIQEFELIRFSEVEGDISFSQYYELEVIDSTMSQHQLGKIIM